MDVFLAGFEMPEFMRQPMGELLINAMDPELFVHLLAWDGDGRSAAAPSSSTTAPPGSTTSPCLSSTAAAGSGTPSPPR